jgi:hypothetical protein
VLNLMAQIACKLGATRQWCLRSGHADGADRAFEYGCDRTNGRKEIWLPWDGFNGAPKWEDTNGWTHVIASDRDVEIAAQFHPAWNRCSRAGKLMHTRNVGQILGRWIQPVPSENDPDPDYGGGAYEPYRQSPSEFVICWTKDGKASGGTGQAIRIAKAYGIPVRNLHDPETREAVERFLRGE